MNKSILLLALAVLSAAAWWLAPYFGVAEYSAQIHSLRLPRATLAWFSGGALAVSGLLMQTLLRNDLATPFTLGVASSASFGAFICFAFPALATTIWAPQLLGFICAISTLLFIIKLGTTRLGYSGILLVGITINFVFGAALMIVRHLAPPYRMTKLEHWLMGSIETSDFDSSITIGLISLLCLSLIWSKRHDLDQFSFDVAVARARGVNVAKLLTVGLATSGLLCTAVVTQCGPIAFIGLVVPHALRPFIGNSHRHMIPACWLLGSGFLALADTLSRSLLILGRSSDIPVGIITALIGGPAFLFIVLRKSTKYSH
jgi:iron complex transport system permease protein